MKIREANKNDISGILKVLKASLGEQSSKKTIEVWNYKHVKNPFGPSLVLIAEENDEIIGVRAFMRWEWQQGKNVYSALRAVDTATHPDHQGKGIFKKLTLKALEIAKINNDDFVFNTPNSQSKPGYIKMGWKEVSKLNVRLVPVNPIYWKRKSHLNEVNYSVENFRKLNLDNWNEQLKELTKIFVPKNEEYLKWRYYNNPMQSYMIASTNEYFIAGYVKKHTKFRELRISELIFNSGVKKKVIEKIENWAKGEGVQVISIQFPFREKFSFLDFSGSFGPVLTFKKINSDIDEDLFLQLENWGYSLGDLELF